MKPNKLAVLLLIFILALFFRIYKLAEIPYGFHVDEVKAGWNAYSILTSGRDDKGNYLPLYYDSFGDFRPAGLIYFMIPFLAIMGKSVMAVRLPFALIGALTIWPFFLLVSEIFKNKFRLIPYLSAVMLALNPWHIVASRSTSESVAALFFAVFGIYFFVYLYRKNNLIAAFLSIICLLISYFFYHNIRVLAPLYLVVAAVMYKVLWDIKLKVYQVGIIILIILSSLLVFTSPEARGRLSQVGLKSDFQVLYEVTKMPTEEGPGHVFLARAFHNRAAAYIRRFAEEYREYFSVDFLVGSNAKPIRYTVPQVGLLTYVELICVLLGLIYLSANKELLLVVVMLLIAPLPAAITIEDTPNLQRAMFMVPFLVILAAFGLNQMFNLKKQWRWLSILLVLFGMANFVYFWHMYLVHQKMSIATYYRDGGNVELVNKVMELNDQFDKIILTNSPDELLPWFEFLSTSKFDNLLFSSEKCPGLKLMELKQIVTDKTLYIDAEGCNFDSQRFPDYVVNSLFVIKRPDNSPPYYLRTISKNEARKGKL